MSAFMVSRAHIDAIVAVAVFGPSRCAASNWRGPYFGNPSRRATYCIASEIGEMLVKENLSSIHHLYSDTATNPTTTPGPIEQYWLAPYVFPCAALKPRKLPDALQTLKLITCYEYQSCEHPEWHDSDARDFCESLRRALIRALPGYDAAPWEWNEQEVR